MHTVSHFEANRFGENIILDMAVTDGVDAWTGRKGVPLTADLKIEADILAAEIVEANKVKSVEAAVEPIPVDVSKIVVEVKTLEEAMAAKPKLVEEVIEAPVEEPVIE